MFDNLRQQSIDEPAEAEEATAASGAGFSLAQLPAAAGTLKSLTPPQRFILALMLFLNVSVLGCLALMVAGRVVLF